MSCAVGNEAARDAAKHTAAFLLRAAVAAVVPSAGLCNRAALPSFYVACLPGLSLKFVPSK
jgi:hypothetical protein